MRRESRAIYHHQSERRRRHLIHQYFHQFSMNIPMTVSILPISVVPLTSVAIIRAKFHQHLSLGGRQKKNENRGQLIWEMHTIGSRRIRPARLS